MLQHQSFSKILSNACSILLVTKTMLNQRYFQGWAVTFETGWEESPFTGQYLQTKNALIQLYTCCGHHAHYNRVFHRRQGKYTTRREHSLSISYMAQTSSLEWQHRFNGGCSFKLVSLASPCKHMKYAKYITLFLKKKSNKPPNSLRCKLL